MLAGTGCSEPSAGGGNTSGGSVGISRDDALVYAADGDLDVLFVMDTSTHEIREIPVGRQPEKVLVGPDDTVYVTNRLGRSVSVIRKGDTAESARVAVGVEPVSLAVSTDGKTLYVVNATSLTDSDFGTLMAIDTATLSLKWELPVGQEPRALTLLGDGRAALSLYKQGELVFVDLATAKVTRAGTGLFEALNGSALGITQPTLANPPPFDPRFTHATSRPLGLEAMTVSADGKQLYVASLLSSDATLPAAPPDQQTTVQSGGSYGGGVTVGAPLPCKPSSVATPALLTFAADGTPAVDDLTTCTGEGQEDRPPMLSRATNGFLPVPVQGPRALGLEATGRFLFVVNQESDNVTVMTTSTGARPFAPQQVSVGSGPTGIAISRDGKSAWVFNAFDHSLSKLSSLGGPVTNTGTTRLANRETLSAAAVWGRKLFFSATDARMNDPTTGISCATCHLEGREDGHVWNFSDGPRQTPSLQGRMLAQTAPFHWNGEFENLRAFMTHTVTRRMGGQGVSDAMEAEIADFIASMPRADNPHRDAPAELKQRGQAAFEKAECGSCHGGATFTDNTFSDVGTFVRTGAVLDDLTRLPHGGLNTPSLLGLARTAPYLHDGSALTLKARLLTGKNLDRHGKTSRLSDAEVDDLVAYLKSLEID
ncbi:MAG: c-type cytochrome [Archangium sp.]|nr:c-type cytochrome [Archangium sp.]